MTNQHFAGALALALFSLAGCAGPAAVTLTEPSFNSGLVWKVTGEDTLRLTAARGVQLPTLTDQGLQVAAGQVAPLEPAPVVRGNSGGPGGCADGDLHVARVGAYFAQERA